MKNGNWQGREQERYMKETVEGFGVSTTFIVTGCVAYRRTVFCNAALSGSCQRATREGNYRGVNLAPQSWWQNLYLLQ